MSVACEGADKNPHGGLSNIPEVITINDLSAEQFSQELRLQSSFDGRVNFNVGGIYMNLERLNNIYIIPNTHGA